MLLQIVQRVLNRHNLFGIFVGNLDAELLLNRHDQLDEVQRIGIQVIRKRRARHDLCFVDAELFGDHRLQPRLEIVVRHVHPLSVVSSSSQEIADYPLLCHVTTDPSTPLTKRPEFSPPKCLASSTASLITAFDGAGSVALKRSSQMAIRRMALSTAGI